METWLLCFILFFSFLNTCILIAVGVFLVKTYEEKEEEKPIPPQEEKGLIDLPYPR